MSQAGGAIADQSSAGTNRPRWPTLGVAMTNSGAPSVNTPVEQRELTALMQIYEEGLLRKAEAIREAVRRGLRGRVAS